MEQRIRQLDDETAVRVLGVFAQARADGPDRQTALTTPLRSCLREQFGETPAEVSAGDLAREALAILAMDAQDAAGIDALIARPPPVRFDGGATLALGAAVLIALQTRVRFERKPDGRYAVLIEKPSATSALLTPLVQKLLAWVPDGPFGKT